MPLMYTKVELVEILKSIEALADGDAVCLVCGMTSSEKALKKYGYYCHCDNDE